MFMEESNNNVIKYKIEKNEIYDSCTFGMTRENQIDGLVTVGMAGGEENGERIFLFKVSNLIPIKEALPLLNDVYAFDILYNFALQVSDILKRLEDYMIPECELVLCSDLCFAQVSDDGSFKLKMVCVPSLNVPCLCGGVCELFLSVFSCVCYENDAERAEGMELMHFISSDGFSVEELLLRLKNLAKNVKNPNNHKSGMRNKTDQVKKEKRKNRKPFLKRLLNAFEVQSADFDDEIFDFEESVMPSAKKLCVLAVRSSGDEYPIYRSELIGTDPSACSICFAKSTHPEIHAEHCRITMFADKCLLENLCADGETSVNGRNLDSKERYELKPADVIQVGKEKLIFSCR